MMLTALELLELCQEREEMDLLFGIVQIAATGDPTGGEANYCYGYDKQMFKEELREIEVKKDLGYNHTYMQGLPIYALFLNNQKLGKDGLVRYIKA